MKFKGYYFTDSESGLARLISPTRSRVDGVWVPVDRTTSFRKLPCPSPVPVPREVEFVVEPWLAAKPEFQDFTTV